MDARGGREGLDDGFAAVSEAIQKIFPSECGSGPALV